ncbi:MAG: hypothetical protein GYA33_03710, partial [Thermogutta sp.]|nr:hypothetical protein [Thermogutta sp.]
ARNAWDDRHSEDNGGTSRSGDSESRNTSPRATGSGYGSSPSGDKASSGSRSSTAYDEQDYRSGYSGYSSPEQGPKRDGAGASVSRPTAIPPAETSESADPSRTSRQTDAYPETAASGANQTASAPPPPGASSGIGMETLLGLVGLLILFVQSMRWLSGFYDRAYRRPRSRRTTRRRPYYDRDVRPVYRSYW